MKKDQMNFSTEMIMASDDLNELSQMWLDAKDREAKATNERRKIEDRIKSLCGIAETLDGTETIAPNNFTIKVVGRMDRKVDSEKLQELAAEYGLSEHLSSLFRWKPEINMAVWKAANETITRPLEAAITVKPGRASFTITPKE